MTKSWPTTGAPGLSQTLLNPDGTIKQKRLYDEVGMRKETEIIIIVEMLTFFMIIYGKMGKEEKSI